MVESTSQIYYGKGKNSDESLMEHGGGGRGVANELLNYFRAVKD